MHLYGLPQQCGGIAAFLLERGMDRFQMIVASCLNTNDERISSHTLSEAAATAFRGDESVFLLPLSEKEQTGTLRFGLDESRLALDRGLYTKGSGAGCALSLLSPSPENTLWDIGAGCGCLSLEAATLLHRGRVVALERDPSRADLIRENRRRLGLPHLDVVSGSARRLWRICRSRPRFRGRRARGKKMCGAPNVFWNALFYG